MVEPAQRHDVNKRSQRDKDRDSRWQQYRTKESHRQENNRPLVKTSHPTPKVIEARQHPTYTPKHSKPEKHSSKPQKQDKRKEDRHEKRFGNRHGG